MDDEDWFEFIFWAGIGVTALFFSGYVFNLA